MADKYHEKLRLIGEVGKSNVKISNLDWGKKKGELWKSRQYFAYLIRIISAWIYWQHFTDISNAIYKT